MFAALPNGQAQMAELQPSELSLIEAARKLADETPQAEVFIGRGAPVSAGSLRDDAEALAAALWHRGLRRGDVISFQLPNWHESAVINLASSALGLICSPLVPIYRGAELRFMLRDSASKLVFIPEQFANFDFASMYRDLVDEMSGGPIVSLVRGNSPGAHDYEPLVAAGRNSARPHAATPNLDDRKLLLYTSGTTGEPKGVLHSQRTLNHAMARSMSAWNLQRGDCMLMPSPVTHATGYVNALELPFLFGTQSLLMNRWNASEAVDLIDRFAVSATVGATPFLRELVDAVEAAGSSLPSLKVFACGGASVPPELIDRANRLLARRPAFRLYGSSEAPYVTLGFPASEDPVRAAQSDGRISGYEVRLLDDAGRDAVPGVSGEIAVRGPSLFLGYVRVEDTAGSFTSDGFFKTGDIGVRDGEDALTITDRKKDLIIRGGENISPREIEELLEGHPGVAEAAVVAIPHDRLGEGICAFVVARRNALPSLAEIHRFLRSRELARQKWPDAVYSLGQLPRTPSGKVRKDVLRRDAAQRCAVSSMPTEG